MSNVRQQQKDVHGETDYTLAGGRLRDNRRLLISLAGDITLLLLLFLRLLVPKLLHRSKQATFLMGGANK